MTNSFTRIVYHVVFGTKYRAPLICPEIRDPLYRYLQGIVQEHGGILFEIGGMPDHVHILLQLRGHHPIATMVQHLKGASSRWLQKGESTPEGTFWQRGYGAFSVSESNIPRVATYIQHQEEHHRRITFRHELIRLLEIHNIPFEETGLED